MSVIIIIESTIAILSVIGLVWCGIFIGREFGSFEKFVIYFVTRLTESLTKGKGDD